jgi:predicted AlkP superfamily pyrophosphatase or phosphodiesterase
MRTLVINIAGLSRNLVGEVPSLVALAARGAALDLEPVLPAVTCPMQATLTTGVPPARHGIVANGLYLAETGEVRFWEQSARLLTARRIWECGTDNGQRGARNSERGAERSAGAGFSSLSFAPRSEFRAPLSKVAMLFWQHSLYGSADVLLTPKPVHKPDGSLVQDCYSRPGDLYARLSAGESALEPGKPRGPFNLMHYWGPLAGLGSSRWIADATLAVWRHERPDLLLTYLPHLDYSGHRAGPHSDAHRAAARELEPLLAALMAAAQADGGRVVVLSECSFVPVRRAVAPNRTLREAGFLAVREVEGREYLHPGDSRAFAMVDNQAAHVYFPASRDPASAVAKVKALFEGLDGVAEVLDRAALAARGLDHPRSGDLVLLAQPDAHFTYYWWLDDAKAPPFARTVDIHAKPGFDAAELLFDPATRGIPLSAAGIHGSHGLVAPAPAAGGGSAPPGWGVYLDSRPPASLAGRKTLRATDVAGLLIADV